MAALCKYETKGKAESQAGKSDLIKASCKEGTLN